MAVRALVIACFLVVGGSWRAQPKALPQPSDPFPPSYRQCIDLLREARAAEATERVLALDRLELGDMLQQVRQRLRASAGVYDPRDIQAAVLLHIEVARRPNATPPERALHTQAAWNLLAAAGDSVPREVERDHRLLLIWSLQQQVALDDLIKELGVALERYPADPEFVLAQGSLWEALASMPHVGYASIDGSEAIREVSRKSPVSNYIGLEVSKPGIFEKCRRLYTRALERTQDSTPAEQEIRIRLARVLEQAGKPEQALEALNPFAGDAESALPLELRYLAALFRGRALLRLQQPDAASDAYRSATTLLPGCQAGHVALGSALRAAGDPVGARQVAEGMLAGAGDCRFDPWLNYPAGQTWRLAPLVARLHQEVRR